MTRSPRFGRVASSEASPARPAATNAGFREILRLPPLTSDWMMLDQERVDAFAAATGDDAFIHTDPPRAAGIRFGGTSAHGLLSLAILPRLMRSTVPTLATARMGVNYSYDRVRFLAPVPTGSRVRGHFSIAAVEQPRPGFATIAHNVGLNLAASGRRLSPADPSRTGCSQAAQIAQRTPPVSAPSTAPAPPAVGRRASIV